MSPDEHPVHRLACRGQIAAGRNGQVAEIAVDAITDLKAKVDDGQLATASLFRWRDQLFFYGEGLGAPIEPAHLMPKLTPLLTHWPGAATPRPWVPMMDIFHYNAPEDGAHWHRPDSARTPWGRLIYLRPHMVSRYIFYHFQMQEEKPGSGDKYGMISIHENLLFFYGEEPAVVEAARRPGMLDSQNTPPNWHEVMFPHFQPWPDDDGEELWRRIELVATTG